MSATTVPDPEYPTVLVVKTPKDFPPPLLAYAPTAGYGCLPAPEQLARAGQPLLWVSTDACGHPIGPHAEPAESPTKTMCMFRLAQAYAALHLTECDQHRDEAATTIGRA